MIGARGVRRSRRSQLNPLTRFWARPEVSSRVVDVVIIRRLLSIAMSSYDELLALPEEEFEARLDGGDYRELQAMCKYIGISAGGSAGTSSGAFSSTRRSPMLP